MNKHFGIFIMRGQPPHLGHKHVIDKIINDGLTPIIILGSANKLDKVRNPYTLTQRIAMLNLMFDNSITIGHIKDYECNDEWISALQEEIITLTSSNITKSTIYLHEKLEDQMNFTFRGIDYTDTSYCKMYEVVGLHTTTLKISDIPIRAKAIRENIEKTKTYLHQEVYKFIKELQYAD